MRACLVSLVGTLLLTGCSGLYPEYTPIIQQEIVANEDNLAKELSARDPPARLMFGMMVAKARCDAFWQELERHRTAGEVLLHNLNFIAKTVSPVLHTGLNEKAVANTIWAIGLGAEFLKSKNEIALLAVDKYRTALREKTEAKQLIYFDLNKAHAENLLAKGPNYAWTRYEADEVNFRIYSYARLCTRPELLMTFDQLVMQSKITTEAPLPPAPPPVANVSRSGNYRGAPAASRRSTDLPGFTVAR